MPKKIDILDSAKKVVGSLDLPDAVFAAEVNVPLLHQVVKAQLAGRRRGTQSTKTKAEVSGGGKKPWKQKGTGRARSGSTRSPVWRGGGISHGPKPRDYAEATPKKMRRAAITGALSSIFAEGRLKVVDTLAMEGIKTKTALSFLKGIEAANPTLVIHGEGCANFVRSVRNVPDVKTLPVEGVNVYDLLNYQTVVCTKDAVAGIEKRLAK
ncbi:MAG: 50S ribosomal protein L4 [Nitrospinae bacterium]|nr:50S ribosomal protein L4 [Nitrospinota bacterium]